MRQWVRLERSLDVGHASIDTCLTCVPEVAHASIDTWRRSPLFSGTRGRGGDLAPRCDVRHVRRLARRAHDRYRPRTDVRHVRRLARRAHDRYRPTCATCAGSRDARTIVRPLPTDVRQCAPARETRARLRRPTDVRPRVRPCACKRTRHSAPRVRDGW